MIIIKLRDIGKKILKILLMGYYDITKSMISS